MTEQQQNQDKKPIFRLMKMYIKDLSFENPSAPAVFLDSGQEPKVDFNLKLGNRKLNDENWEVSMSITAKVMDNKSDDDTPMFIIEIEHAGIFMLKNIPSEHIERVLGVDCPIMLFPFTRQVVSNVTVEGGFLPFLMEPINFHGLYENAKRKKEESH